MPSRIGPAASALAGVRQRFPNASRLSKRGVAIGGGYQNPKAFNEKNVSEVVIVINMPALLTSRSLTMHRRPQSDTSWSLR